jgi:hypothetical protein
MFIKSELTVNEALALRSELESNPTLNDEIVAAYPDPVKQLLVFREAKESVKKLSPIFNKF